DDADLVLCHLTHVLGAVPVHARHRCSVDNGVVVSRGSVVDAVSGGKQLYVGQVYLLHRVAWCEAKCCVEWEHPSRSFPITFMLVRTVARYVVESDTPRNSSASNNEGDWRLDAVPRRCWRCALESRHCPSGRRPARRDHYHYLLRCIDLGARQHCRSRLTGKEKRQQAQAVIPSIVPHHVPVPDWTVSAGSCYNS